MKYLMKILEMDMKINITREELIRSRGLELVNYGVNRSFNVELSENGEHIAISNSIELVLKERSNNE